MSLVDRGRQWFLSNESRPGGHSRNKTKMRLLYSRHYGKLRLSDSTRCNQRPSLQSEPSSDRTSGHEILCWSAIAFSLSLCWSAIAFSLRLQARNLVCAGHKAPTRQGLTLEEKQTLIALAALAVQALVRFKKSTRSKTSMILLN
jgi:hypothetical protein